jgi:hypothetical protein
MTSYIVQLPAGSGGSLLEGHNAIIVEAEDAADAKAAAATHAALSGVMNADSLTTLWASATTTEIAASDADGHVLTCSFTGAVAQTETNIILPYTGIAADVMDDMGDGLVVVANLHAEIGSSAYDSMTQILIVAAIGDGMGDATLTCTYTVNGVEIPSAIGAIVHEGIAAAVLSVVLAADAVVIPGVLGSYKT